MQLKTENYYDTPFRLVDLSEKSSQLSEGEDTVTFKLKISGREIPFGITYEKSEAGLGAIMPLAHAVCDKVNEISAGESEHADQPVSCKKGCAACCRYMVSLSSAEAFFLHDYVLSLASEKRRRIVGMFMRAAKIISENRMPNVFSSYTAEYDQLRAMSDWYQGLELKCPFLEENTCSIYAVRPLVCREHLVTSIADACNPSSSKERRLLGLPFSTAETMMAFCGDIEGNSGEALLLALTMFWCGSNSARLEKIYPAAMLAEKFAKAISAAAEV